MLVRLVAILVVMDVSFCTAKEPADTNYDESKVPEYELPELLLDDSQEIRGKELKPPE